MADTAARGAARTQSADVFVRHSSGLVREMSAGDALIGNVLIFNLVIASVTLLVVPFTFPGASLPGGILLAFIPAGLIAAVYVFFSVAMPRSGGDYVFISRTLHPALGFAANFSFVGWNAIWIGVYSNWVATVGLSGLFASLGLTGGTSFWSGLATGVSGHWPAFIIGTLVNIGIAAIVMSGLRPALRVMKSLFYVGTFGVLVAIVVVGVTSNSSFVAGINHVTSYQGIIDAAHTAGYASPAGWTQLGPTVLSVGLLSLSMVFVMYSAYTGGEVKNVARSMPISIYGSLLVGGVLFLLMGIVAVNAWGNDFIAAINTVFYLAPSSYTLAAAPNYNYLAAIGNPNLLLILLINLGWVLIPIAAIIFNYIPNSRCVFAWSFDRIFPTKAAEVSDRFHSPVVATLIVAVAAEASIIGYTFFGTTQFLGGTVMGYSATFLTTAVAAIFFPYLKRSKWMYEASPLKPRLAGIPVMSIIGVLTVIVFGVMIYGFLTNSLFAANVPQGLVFFGALWVVGFVIYVIAYAVRSSQGVPFGAAFAELPPE
jgi:basic amino acid/polyamine antiporter, APA family